MPTVDDVLVMVSAALFKSWFPNGHSGAWEPEFQEDFDNWVDIALADSRVIVSTLIDAGLLSVSDSAKVEEQVTNDEGKP